MDAIAFAGGFSTPLAEKILVIRQMPNEKEPIRIAVNVMEAQHGNENLALAPGDTVTVEYTPIAAVGDMLQTFIPRGRGSLDVAVLISIILLIAILEKIWSTKAPTSHAEIVPDMRHYVHAAIRLVLAVRYWKYLVAAIMAASNLVGHSLLRDGVAPLFHQSDASDHQDRRRTIEDFDHERNHVLAGRYVHVRKDHPQLQSARRRGKKAPAGGSHRFSERIVRSDGRQP